MMKDRNALFYGILLGTIVGSVGTLLTTPSSGKDTINKMVRNKETFMNTGKEFALETKNMVRTLKTASKTSTKNISDLSTDIKKLVNNWKSDTVQNKHNLQAELMNLEKNVRKLEKTMSNQ